MERFAFATQEDFEEIEDILRKKHRLSFQVELPDTCFERYATLTIQKEFWGYQLIIEPRIHTFSENPRFRTFIKNGHMHFYHYELLIDFFEDLQKSYPYLYKRKYRLKK